MLNVGFDICDICESNAIDETSEPSETRAGTCFRNITLQTQEIQTI